MEDKKKKISSIIIALVCILGLFSITGCELNGYLYGKQTNV